MGHREALLAGARQCLSERGYAGTTARHIVAASGTNLASIGYHFGSKDALLVAALVEALADWGADLEQRLTAVAGRPDALDRLEATWAAVIESVGDHRQLWLATYEAFVQVDRSPDLRQILASAYESARAGLAAMLLWAPAEPGSRVARTVGSFQLALVSGLSAQWLLDPGSAPAASDVVAGLRALVAAMHPEDDDPGQRAGAEPAG